MFIADHAQDVLKQKQFVCLHVDTMTAILALPNLKASDQTIAAATDVREATLKSRGTSEKMAVGKSFSAKIDLAPVTIDDLINQAEVLHAVAKVIADNDISMKPLTEKDNKAYDSDSEGPRDPQRLCGNFTHQTKERSLSIFLPPADFCLDKAFLCSSDEESLRFSPELLSV